MTTYFPGILSNGALVPGLAAGTVRDNLGLGTADSPTFAGVLSTNGKLMLQPAISTIPGPVYLFDTVDNATNGSHTIASFRGNGTSIFNIATGGVTCNVAFNSNSINLTRNNSNPPLSISNNAGLHFTLTLNANSTQFGLSGPGILSQRNGTNAQISEIYKTFTSATSNERLAFDTTAAGFYDIVAGRGSAGGASNGIRIGGKLDGGSFVPWLSLGNLQLTVPSGTTLTSGAAAGVGVFNINNDGNSRWSFNAGEFLVAGNIRPTTNNSRQLGTTSNRWSHIFTTALTVYGQLNLRASTTAADTAPIKIPTGVLQTTPQAGAVEYDGTNLYFTDSGGTRNTLREINTITFSEFESGNDYVYHGGIDSDGDWAIYRYDNVTATRLEADESNNPGTVDLATAWTNRATLVYA